VRLIFYHAQIAADRIRFAQIQALREGREPPEPVDELGRHLASLFATMSVRHARPPDDLLDRRRSVGAHSDWGMPLTCPRKLIRSAC